MKFRAEYVLDGLFIHSLLMEMSSSERNLPLRLPHGESQMLRMQTALEARNAILAGPGQEGYLHTCQLCAHYFEKESGRLG